MSIITISRGSYSKGKAIAEKLAQKLGYECISREILLEASKHFNIPEVKLIRALHDAPSILERFSHGKERFISFFRDAFLEYMQKDNIVYHGLAGHFFLQDISHVMKVRILSKFTDRIQEEMKRENISEEKARSLLKKDDEERRKWSRYLYDIDTADASLYDIVLHIDNLNEDDAVDILADMAGRPCFRTTEKSIELMRVYRIAAKAEALLAEQFPGVRVRFKKGVLHVFFQKPFLNEEKIIHQVHNSLEGIDGIKEIRTNIIRRAPFVE